MKILSKMGKTGGKDVEISFNPICKVDLQVYPSKLHRFKEKLRYCVL